MIKIDKLQKKFGEKVVLDNINALFLPGHVYGIVGANAAGKTTFFRCLAGLESYTGHIEATTMPIKDRLGYLVAEHYFLPKITGEEYLLLLTSARGQQVRDLHTYNIFDLPLKNYVSSYSTGMKKKLAIMGVLLQDNDYFIFDEPYNGLDLQSSMMLTTLIAALREKGKIILLSSHIFATLKESCDELFLLEKGTFARQLEKDKFATLEAELKAHTWSADLMKLINR